MRKLLLALVVAGTCLIPGPPRTEAAVPCGSTCCASFMNANSACMYPATVWTTCGWYWANINNQICP